jgi:Tfp pilus assembly protein PilF
MIARTTILLILTIPLLLGGRGGAMLTGGQAGELERREDLYRKNNLGVALMEQYKHEEAAARFREALAEDAGFVIGRINLALALYFQNDGRGATTEALAALKLAPENQQALYVLGASYKKDRLYPEALAVFERLLKLDGRDPYTNLQVGQIHSAGQQYGQAVDYFRRALDAEPYNATAAYSLAQALIRSGKVPEGQQMLARFQQLKASGYATTLGLTYGEQGRYAEGVVTTGIESGIRQSVGSTGMIYRRDESEAGLRSFSPGTGTVVGRRIGRGELTDELKRQLVIPFSTGQSVGDLDGDRQPDLIVNGVDERGRPFIRLLRNSSGRLSEVTGRSGPTADQFVSGTVAGDFDNDGRTDLAVFGYRHLAIWRNEGDGNWSNQTAKAGLPGGYDGWALTGAWVDVDHDGDLDLVVGNFVDLDHFPAGETAIFPDEFTGGGRKLYRNNGNGTFADITKQAGLGGEATRTTAVIGTDFNNQRDIDLLFINYGSPTQLFSNQRDGSFREVAGRVGLGFNGRGRGVGAGDLNKDNYTDLYFAAAEEDQLYLSDGRGGFVRTTIEGGGGSLAAQMVDFDLDGILDVVTLGESGIRWRRGIGQGLAAPVDAGLQGSPGGRGFGLVDLDGDGGHELTIPGEGNLAGVFRPAGFGRNFARLQVTGRTSNRSAAGTKVELRSGSLRQKLEVYAASPAPAASGVTFGLGFRTRVDAVQLFWPAGILQSELAVNSSTREQPVSQIDELDRKGTSCPILYAWNGTEYEFVTDFLGGSAFAALVAPGRYSSPDTDEYVRLTSEQLREKDGRLSVRLNNQLEEVIFFDAVKLLAVDHPAEVEVYPNERLMPGPPFPALRIHTTRGARPPAAARDDRGADILPLISKIDRRYPEGFEKLPFKGYAREHAIELDLGEIPKSARALLLLHAWIDYADSTSNYAAAQAGERLTPPYLQVRNRRGEWQTVIPQMGFPAGLPKTMTVDLTGKFLSDDRRIRIVTGMRIYWDQILVDTSDDKAGTRVSTLDALAAELRWRGFPREYSPDGRRPLIYDYRTIEPSAPWKAHSGNYTRYGDVRELLNAPDNRYVITRSGDELQVDFATAALPVLRDGWRRTWLLHANGFGKDMDLHSAQPETIGELPFHGMDPYPRRPRQQYPLTRENLEYLERYNTRTVTPLTGRTR